MSVKHTTDMSKDVNWLTITGHLQPGFQIKLSGSVTCLIPVNALAQAALLDNHKTATITDSIKSLKEKIQQSLTKKLLHLLTINGT